MKTDVFIVILNWNSSDETLSLVKNLNYLTNKDFRILVIDNDSKREQKEALTRLGNHVSRVIYNTKNLGYAGGNNIGIEYAMNEGADYVWILNPDIRTEPDALELLIESIKKDKSIAAIGPRICFRNDKKKIFSDGGRVDPTRGYFTYHEHSTEYIDDHPASKLHYDIDYVDGSAILMQTSAVRKTGLFREDFFLYFEETEWCMRAKRLGWNLAVNTRSVVYQRPSPKNYRYFYYMMRNRLWLAKLDGGRYKMTRSILLNQTIGSLRKISRKNFFQTVAAIHGLAAGCCLNPRVPCQK